MNDFGHLHRPEPDRLQPLDRNPGQALARIVVELRRLQMGPAAVEPVGLVGLEAFRGAERILEALAVGGLHFGDAGLIHHALSHQTPAVDFDHRRVLADPLVHDRLGECRLVGLVVAEAAIAEHVDDHRFAEFLPELGGDLGREHHRFGIVAVDVEDRRLDHLGHVARIGRGSRKDRAGGEADLVVDDEVDGAAGPVPPQPRQPEAFGHHALTGERGIAVHQQRQHRGAFVVAALVLLGPDLAEHHRIDDLEVRGVGGERQVHPVVVELAIRGRTEVVLHVARAFDVLGARRAALELVKDGAERLLHHVGENVQAAAMRHAEHDLLDPERAAALDDLLERRNGRFRAVETEAFGSRVFDVEELLEAFRLDELVEDAFLADGGEFDDLVGPLDALLYPRLLHRIGNVHELDAEAAAIGSLQEIGDLPDSGALEPEHVVDENRPVEVSGSETVGRRVELRLRFGRSQLERIEICRQMPAHAVGADHHQRTHRIHCGAADVIARRSLGLLARRSLRSGCGDGFGGRPEAVHGGEKIAVAARQPVSGLPRCAAQRLLRLVAVLGQPGEERPPLRIDRQRIFEEAPLHILDIGRVAAPQERGRVELPVAIALRHSPHISISAADPRRAF